MNSMQEDSLTDLELRSQAELRDTLISLYQEFEPPEDLYMWPIESMRWNELAYCILERWSSELEARSATNALSELDLLEVRKLAQLAEAYNAGKPSKRGKLILGILVEAGFDNVAAERALTNLIEASRTIWEKLGGQVQRLLRQESEKLIISIAESFDFSDLDDESARQIMTRWLQNVLNLPVYLETEGTRTFCTEMNITPSELVDTADLLDINLAIVDELLQQWYVTRSGASGSVAEVSGLETESIGTVQSGDQEQEVSHDG